MRSKTDLRDVVEMAAKSRRRPVTACQIYDPNVCRFRSEQGWQPVATSGFPFTRHFCMTRLGRKVATFANPDFVLIEISGERLGPAFCVGHADKILYWEDARQHVQGQQRLPVYVPAGTAPKQEA